MPLIRIGLEKLPSLFGDAVGISFVPVPLRLKWGSLSLKYELEVLAHLCRFHRPKTVFEFGTFEGLTTLLLAMNSPQASVWTLDLPRGKDVKTRFRVGSLDKRCIRNRKFLFFNGTPYKKRIRTLAGDSATFDFSRFRGRVDMVFVDGAHTGGYTESDSENAMAMLRKGGIVVWHDFNPRYWPETVRYLRALSKTQTLYHIRGTYLVFWLNR